MPTPQNPTHQSTPTDSPDFPPAPNQTPTQPTPIATPGEPTPQVPPTASQPSPNNPPQPLPARDLLDEYSRTERTSTTMVPDIHEQMWLATRTMLAIKFFEHDTDLRPFDLPSYAPTSAPNPTYNPHLPLSATNAPDLVTYVPDRALLTSPRLSWNTLDEADKTKYYKMAQDTMSNGAHDVVYGESIRRRSNAVRMAAVTARSLVAAAVDPLNPSDPTADTPPRGIPLSPPTKARMQEFLDKEAARLSAIIDPNTIV